MANASSLNLKLTTCLKYILGFCEYWNLQINVSSICEDVEYVIEDGLYCVFDGCTVVENRGDLPWDKLFSTFDSRCSSLLKHGFDSCLFRIEKFQHFQVLLLSIKYCTSWINGLEQLIPGCLKITLLGKHTTIIYKYSVLYVAVGLVRWWWHR